MESQAEAWRRVGGMLVRRRARLDPQWRFRKSFIEANGLRPKTVQDIERGYRLNYRVATLAALENAYQLPSGAIDRAVADPECMEFLDGATLRGKLVRDRIPQIIRDSGQEPITRVADAIEYRELLRVKLAEEVAEFLDSGDDLEELADVLEVVYAMADYLYVDRADLETLRSRKAAERGGFAGRVVWLGNRPA